MTTKTDEPMAEEPPEALMCPDCNHKLEKIRLPLNNRNAWMCGNCEVDEDKYIPIVYLPLGVVQQATDTLQLGQIYVDEIVDSLSEVPDAERTLQYKAYRRQTVEHRRQFDEIIAGIGTHGFYPDSSLD
jgi:hypothetical protein